MGEFAAASARLAGFAGVLFGWRPDEFWSATPAELAAVIAALRGEDTLSGEQLAQLRDLIATGRPLHRAVRGPPPQAQLGEDYDG